MTAKKVGCIKDLSGVSEAMGNSGLTGTLSFVGQQAYVTTVASDANSTVTYVDGVATSVTPITDGAHDVGGGGTITTVGGIITEKTAVAVGVTEGDYVIAVGDTITVGAGGVITAYTPAGE